jgi:hypothetical protein
MVASPFEPSRCVHSVMVGAVAACFVFVAACNRGPTIVVWEKPGATAAELEEARAACAEEPAERDPERINRTRYQADTAGKQFVECMNERGFTWRTERLEKAE